MGRKEKSAETTTPSRALLPSNASDVSVPVYLATPADWPKLQAKLAAAEQAWIEGHGFKPGNRKVLPVPGSNGRISALLVGATDAAPTDPMSQPELALGLAAAQAPAGAYHLDSPVADPTLAAVAWGLGAYRFQRYKSGASAKPATLKLPKAADSAQVAAIVDGVSMGRDLINTPSNDMGPAELEAAARVLAKRHGAKVSTIVGDALLEQNFPLIHAVGRASPREPRLIDITWGNPKAPKVTLVGKGICFDTGGLDLKPAAGMLLMKKDMGGAAAALALGHLIMATGLPVRLRILVAAAENSVAGNAFRPGDVITSRAGSTVEIGNTDAEGRLVLADALSLADDDEPDLLATFSTLTGAARVALGPELPPMFIDSDAWAADILAGGNRVGDPLWRMPLWPGYDTLLDSPVADLNNVSEGPFAGSIVAALFMRRFVRRARCFAHFDIYGWRPAPKPLGPRGGEVQGVRAVFAALEQRYRTS